MECTWKNWSKIDSRQSGRWSWLESRAKTTIINSPCAVTTLHGKISMNILNWRTCLPIPLDNHAFFRRLCPVFPNHSPSLLVSRTLVGTGFTALYSNLVLISLYAKFQVIFVDEATSNVDVETAAVMDRLLAEEFRSSTILIVAHRMSSLSYCDHLLILSAGEVR